MKILLLGACDDAKITLWNVDSSAIATALVGLPQLPSCVAERAEGLLAPCSIALLGWFALPLKKMLPGRQPPIVVISKFGAQSPVCTQ